MVNRATEAQRTNMKTRTLCRRAFSVVELLVVIAIIILLAALITGAATVMFRQQKQATTRSVMNNIILAIEQFQAADPLKNIYNLRDRSTFGNLPPLTLANHNVNGSVANLITRDDNLPNDNGALANRLHRDLAGPQYGTTSVNAWVRIYEQDARHHDNRGLYTYLRVFSEKSLTQVPDGYMKRIDPNVAEYVNPKGPPGTPAPGAPGSPWIDVLGFVDAWGVPLDYSVYVKVEWGVRQTASGPTNGFRIVDRRPALRSRGIEKERYEALQFDSSKELWTDDLPKPYAGLTSLQETTPGFYQGLLNDSNNGQTRANGWLRLSGMGDDWRPDNPLGFKYRPN
jgi:type II secretory pathway pseudopilin PulG